jgi:hypothetical protein
MAWRLWQPNWGRLRVENALKLFAWRTANRLRVALYRWRVQNREIRNARLRE